MKLNLAPLLRPLRRRFGRPAPSLSAVAERSWEIAPAETGVVPKAYFLPGQLARIKDWVFIDHHPGPELEGGGSVTHHPTRALLLKDAFLIDGELFTGRAWELLQPRAHRVPRPWALEEQPEGALYSTAVGNRYFGNWLMDDGPKYLLAAAHGRPVSSKSAPSGHAQEYEQRLGFSPYRAHSTYFRELLVFEDFGQNRHKRGRFRALTERLLGGRQVAPHPGVFIVRGSDGHRRLLRNEVALAEHLARTRGFKVLDPVKVGLEAIVEACGGAQVVIGVEGSALAHGVLFLEPGTTIFPLQPPHRFCTVYKDVADRQGLHFAFVVGHGERGDFSIDQEEVERTLDLLPNNPS